MSSLSIKPYKKALPFSSNIQSVLIIEMRTGIILDSSSGVTAKMPVIKAQKFEQQEVGYSAG